MKTGQLSVMSDNWSRHGANRMPALTHFPLKFLLQNTRSAGCIYSPFSIDFSTTPPFKTVQENEGRMPPTTHPLLGRLPKTVLALDHVQLSPSTFGIQPWKTVRLQSTHPRPHLHRQRASHLEHSRPGAHGRRVTPTSGHDNLAQ